MTCGAFRRPGVHAPESLGREPGLLERLLAGLAARGVACYQTIAVEEPATVFA